MSEPAVRTVPPGLLYERAAQFARDLETLNAGTADAMVNAWGTTFSRLRSDYDRLIQRISEHEAAVLAGERRAPLSLAWLYQQERLENALETTAREVSRFALYAEQETLNGQAVAMEAASGHATALTDAALAEAGATGGSFVRINPANVERVAGLLAEGSPVADLFSRLAPDTVDAARNALVQGVGLGLGSRRIAADLSQALDVPRWRAETIARTEALRAYRAVALDTYQANADVMDTWRWTAALDSRTCPACVVMHGTEHPLTETLDGHPRCRCAMVPVVKPLSAILGPERARGMVEPRRPPRVTGKAWLRAQDAATQRAVLGPAKWAAWKRGDLTLDDLVARTESRAWGTMRRERTLSEIAAGRAANY